MQSLIQEPVTWAAVGTVVGFVARLMFDVWTNRVQRNQEFATHFMGRIETMAPTYNLLSTHAHNLSLLLTQYITIKRQLQMEAVEVEVSGNSPYDRSPYDLLDIQAKELSKQALFHVIKLYRVMDDSFFNEGGQYLLPDKWANEAIDSLHRNLMTLLIVDPRVFFEDVKADTREHEFYKSLDTKEDLQEAYDQYQQWLRQEDKQVINALAYAQAYADLFDQQMQRLYKNWFERRRWPMVWRKPIRNPEKAPEVTKSTSLLKPETRELIRRSGEKRHEYDSERTRLILSDLRADPQVDEANVYLNLGWNYYISGQYDLAIREYEKSKQRLPTNPIVHNNSGNAHTSRAAFELARIDFEEAVRLQPKNAVFRANFGRMWHRRGEFYERPDRRDDAESTDSYEKAVHQYKKAVESDPSNFRYHNDVGNAYARLNKWQEAVQAYSQAIALYPLDPVLYRNAAYAYDNDGRYIQAIGAYEKAEQLATEPRFKASCYENIGKIHEENATLDAAGWTYNSFDKAGRAYDKARELDKSRDYSLTHWRDGMAYYRIEDYERALFEYDMAVRLDPYKPHYHYSLGTAYGSLNRWRMAIRSYERALDLDSEQSLYHYSLGLAYREAGLHDEAMISLQKALAKKPDHFHSLLALAQLAVSELTSFEAQPYVREAMEVVQVARASNPSRPLHWLASGTVHLYQGDYAASASAYDRLYDFGSNDDTELRLLNELSVGIYQKAVEEDPDNPELHARLGYAYERVGDFTKAVTAYETAVDLAPDEVRYRALLHVASGNVHFDEQNWKIAIQEWKRALDLAPAGMLDLASVHKNLADAYDRLGQANEALYHYDRVSRTVPDDIGMHYAIGRAHFARKRLQYALDEFQEACRLTARALANFASPLEAWQLRLKYADMVYDVGNCYHRLDHTVLAEKKWQEAVTNNPDLAAALYNLGVLAYKRGSKDQAENYWQQSLARDEKLAEAYYNLGILSLEQGDQSKAMQYWQKARGINSDFERNYESFGQEGSPELAICDVMDAVR